MSTPFDKHIKRVPICRSFVPKFGSVGFKYPVCKFGMWYDGGID